MEHGDQEKSRTLLRYGNPHGKEPPRDEAEAGNLWTAALKKWNRTQGVPWEDCDDVAQDTLLEMAVSKGVPRAAQEARHYAFGIAKYKCYAYFRREKARRAILRDDVDSDNTGAFPPISPDTAVTVREALERLEKRERELLTDRCLCELSYAELADKTGIKVATLRKKIQRLLQRLAGEIKT
jgi:RNA polymerase sigma factor (sigma-70 family)